MNKDVTGFARNKARQMVAIFYLEIAFPGKQADRKHEKHLFTQGGGRLHTSLTS